MNGPLRWGILGTGNIARQFCGAMRTSQRGVLAAVASRSAENAAAFARDHSIPAAYGGYDALLADATVDAVYVSLPNSLHRDWTIRALRAGKHVLCEKPIAVDACQASEMFDAAKQAGRVLAEAFMYRSHPLTDAALNEIRRGAIGQVKLIRTSFCYRTTKIAGNIRFDARLAGGALMDIGCYCISLSRLVAGCEPEAVHAVGILHESGVDELSAGVMRFAGGLVASFTCGMTAQADNTAYICGTEGYIEVPVPWKPPMKQAAYIIAHGTPPRMDGVAKPAPPPRELRTVDADRDLYALEADEFAAAVLDGTPPRVSRDDSVGNMRVLDEMRRQIGVRLCASPQQP